MLGRREFISWLGSFIAGRDDLADDPLRESTATNVIFVAGQSNAVGWNETAATVPSLLQRRSGAMIWTGRAWQYLVNGKNNGKLSSNGSKWGCEAEFARLWALERNERLFIVKHAVGGTALADYWSPATGTGYIAMARYATTAKSALTAKGYTVNSIGLLWMQGESDGVNQAQANAYYANLSNFFARVRSDWGSASMPIVVGRIANQAELTYRTVVRTAQAEVVAGDEHAALVDTDAYGNDGLHYSTNGIVNMGADMYTAWKTLAGPT